MKAVFQRAGLLLFGLALAWLLIEVIARLAGLAESPHLGPQFDRARILYSPEPERQHPWSSGDDDTAFEVAVIGDSFTAGSGVQKDDAYPARLERLLNLNADATPALVRTYARSGTTTHNQVRFLRQALLEEPDLVILGIFLNDAEHLEVLDWHDVMLPRIPSGWKLELLQASHSLAWLYQRFEEWRIQRAYLRYMRTLYDPEFSGWHRFTYALRVFANTCRREGVRLVAIIMPPAAALGPEYPFDYAHQQIHEALAAEKIPFFDLLPVFRGRSADRLAILPGVDGHYNEIGHRIVAEAVFGHLLRAGHLPAEYAPHEATVQSRDYWLRKLHRLRRAVPPR